MIQPDTQTHPIRQENKIDSIGIMKDLLSDGGLLEIIDKPLISYFLIKDSIYASLEIANDILTIKFKRPKDLRGLMDKLSYYTELDNPAGWLEFVTFADNDLQDQLRAELGCFIGQTIFELNSTENLV